MLGDLKDPKPHHITCHNCGLDLPVVCSDRHAISIAMFVS